MSKWIFVDVEATGPCPGMGVMTEFGAVDYKTKGTFHGVLYPSKPHPDNPAKSMLLTEEIFTMPDPGTSDHTRLKSVFEAFSGWLNTLGKSRPIFISDNPAYDFQWINYYYCHTLGENPFGHSGRRISDYYAGLMHDFRETQRWKRFRQTPHDHNPVNDAMGNVEAFEKIQELYTPKLGF